MNIRMYGPNFLCAKNMVCDRYMAILNDLRRCVLGKLRNRECQEVTLGAVESVIDSVKNNSKVPRRVQHLNEPF